MYDQQDGVQPARGGRDNEEMESRDISRASCTREGEMIGRLGPFQEETGRNGDVINV
jgi:hypothetical protein